jgi:flavin-dependent dehydrogenase
MLFDAAAEAGAQLFKSTRCARSTRTSNGWSLHLQSGEESGILSTRFICDCSGRAAAFAQKQGAKRVTYDNLIAIVSLSQSSVKGDTDSTTLIEAVECGWWYTTLLPNGQRVAAYHTDNDLIAAPIARSAERWFELLRQTKHLRQIYDRYEYVLCENPWIVAANSSRLDYPFGNGWLAAGDAAASFDPLSSQGIMTAILSGLQAANAIVGYWQGEMVALDKYGESIKRTYKEYLQKHAWYYSQECRWPDSTFWSRRKADHSAWHTLA